MFVKCACLLLLVATLVIESQGKNDSKRDIPKFFLRKVNSYPNNVPCEKLRMISQPANISLTRMDGQLAYSISIRMASNRHHCKKVELRLELPRIPQKSVKTVLRRKYVADVHLLGNPLDHSNLTVLPTFLDGNYLEIMFDITSLAKTTSIDSPTDLNFAFRITRTSGKALRSLLQTDTKAFVILYEKVASCNIMDFFGHGIDFQKSPETLRGMGVNRKNMKSMTSVRTTELCSVKDFYINFEDLGFKGIIAPEELNIGICGGFCTSRNMKTGYGFLKNAYNERYNQGQPSSCRPSKFGGSSMIYVDPTDGGFVLAHFSDMVVRKCDCH